MGDAMFLAAGTLWAGFGIVLRKHRLDPLLATAVISISALLSYVPAYFWYTGGTSLFAADPYVFWVEVLIQGLIEGVGTLYSYSKMVSLLGPSRAAVFPALAPGLAALIVAATSATSNKRSTTEINASTDTSTISSEITS
ncbi:MAG: hypothetical protein EBW39_03020 [Betaproteobacteria bacterium]|nr:hypothetical protein [Betaproteobacteria bacterium]